MPLSPLGGLVTDGGEAQPVRITSTVGQTPRDFCLLPPAEDGSVAALVANQDDDKIVVLAPGKDAEELTSQVPTPVCLCVV